MIDTFLRTFRITSKNVAVQKDKDFYQGVPTELFNIFDLYGGITFDNGLYRLHSFESSVRWSVTIAEFFNQYRNRIYPFGFDWKGRQFCLNTKNSVLFMFDPATGEDFEINQTLALLHNEDFVNSTDDMLSISFFKEILSFYQKDTYFAT